MGEICSNKFRRRHPEARAAFGEPRRMAACALLSSFEARKKARAPQDDGFGLQRARMLTSC
jgi:hypothetical protein